jgi:hypothetical protein
MKEKFPKREEEKEKKISAEVAPARISRPQP